MKSFYRLALTCVLLTLASAVLSGIAQAQSAVLRPCIRNNSWVTLCGEEDNILIPVYGRKVAGADVVIQAVHPPYSSSLPEPAFQCDPDWRNCPAGPPGGAPDQCSKLFDDGVNAIELCRVEGWWRGMDMAVSVRGGGAGRGHYVRWARKMPRLPFWPQFAVLYQDSNLRLKPFTNRPDPDTNDDGEMDLDNCFSSSVIVGPAPLSTHPRPYADIASIVINPATRCMTITYANGQGTARLCLSVNTTSATATVNASYPANLRDAPIVTFRSMYVSAEVNDAALARVRGREYPILGDWTQLNGTSFFFHRLTPGTHNPTGPDIRITAAS